MAGVEETLEDLEERLKIGGEEGDLIRVIEQFSKDQDDNLQGDRGGEEEKGKEEAGGKEGERETAMTKVEKQLFKDEMKFMQDFDPNERLIKKRMKRFTDAGIVIERCDCLIPNCPGCHYSPCRTCASHFCGHSCRLERKWDYEELEIQGAGPISKRTRQK